MHIRCTEAVNHFALLAEPDFLGFERRSLGRRRRSLPIHHPHIVTSVLSAYKLLFIVCWPRGWPPSRTNRGTIMAYIATDTTTSQFVHSSWQDWLVVDFHPCLHPVLSWPFLPSLPSSVYRQGKTQEIFQTEVCWFCAHHLALLSRDAWVDYPRRISKCNETMLYFKMRRWGGPGRRFKQLHHW